MVGLHNTASWWTWAFLAVEQSFSQSLRSSDKTNTDEANPVKSNKSEKVRREKGRLCPGLCPQRWAVPSTGVAAGLPCSSPDPSLRSCSLHLVLTGETGKGARSRDKPFHVPEQLREDL